MAVSEEILQLFLVLMVLVLILKAAMIVYIGRRVVQKKKNIGKLEIDFLFAIFILFVCLFVSRLLFLYFDFYLTKLDSELYYLHPNVDVWSAATFIESLGFVVAILVLDKDAAQFRLKGIPAGFMLTVSIVKLFWPINSMDDFNFVSSLTLFQSPFILLIPAIFLYIGIKGEGHIRKTSFLVVISVLIYGIGGLIIGEHITGPLREMYGEIALVYIYTIFAITKMVGLTLLSYAITKFYVLK